MNCIVVLDYWRGGQRGSTPALVFFVYVYVLQMFHYSRLNYDVFTYCGVKFFLLAPLKLRPYGAIQMCILLLLLLLLMWTLRWHLARRRPLQNINNNNNLNVSVHIPRPHAMPTPLWLATLKTTLRSYDRLNVSVGHTQDNIFEPRWKTLSYVTHFRRKLLATLK